MLLKADRDKCRYWTKEAASIFNARLHSRVLLEHCMIAMAYNYGSHNEKR